MPGFYITKLFCLPLKVNLDKLAYVLQCLTGGMLLAFLANIRIAWEDLTETNISLA
jgi:hypothetical protein